MLPFATRRKEVERPSKSRETEHAPKTKGKINRITIYKQKRPSRKLYWQLGFVEGRASEGCCQVTSHAPAATPDRRWHRPALSGSHLNDRNFRCGVDPFVPPVGPRVSSRQAAQLEPALAPVRQKKPGAQLHRHSSALPIHEGDRPTRLNHDSELAHT